MRKLGIIMVLMLSLILVGCGGVQSDYYEVHLIVVEETPFYYIDPSEGKDTFSANQFSTGESHFIYLYEAQDGVDFDYGQYFSTIQDRQVEINLSNGKMYVLSSTEIENLILDYFTNKPE